MKAFSYICTASLMILLGSCQYNRPDEPKVIDTKEIKLTPTHTIASLKDLYISGATEITTPVVVEAIMTSDDTEGNLYKSCYISDNTGGIELKLAMGNLSALYPQGTLIYLKAQGMTLGKYGDQINLGYRSTDPKYETAYYPEKLVTSSLVPAGKTELKAELVTIGGLHKGLAGKLIKLNEVQFIASEEGQTYASPTDKQNTPYVERTLEDKNGKRVIVRTSSYAKFAGKQLPKGSGSVTAIVTYFRTTPQLLILRETDVQLNNTRF